VKGLDEISKNKDAELDDINKRSSDAAKRLAEEKEEFIKNSRDSDSLVSDLAEHLNADIVEVDDE
jgi:hypothetical protein